MFIDPTGVFLGMIAGIAIGVYIGEWRIKRLMGKEEKENDKLNNE